MTGINKEMHHFPRQNSSTLIFPCKSPTPQSVRVTENPLAALSTYCKADVTVVTVSLRKYRLEKTSRFVVVLIIKSDTAEPPEAERTKNKQFIISIQSTQNSEFNIGNIWHRSEG